MSDTARHVPLRSLAWNATEAAAAIEEIITDTLANYGGERFWPTHPQDDGLQDSTTSFYFGATGVIWALDYLHRSGASKTSFEFAPVLPHLIEANKAEFARM